MNAQHCSFSKIINGNTQFVIPVFQRDYKWTEAECEQLWKDILLIAGATADRSHFIGSVVYVSTGDSAANFTRWLLIDGQQRLTTITLLLAALRDHIKDTRWTGSEDGPTERRVEAYFLRNMEETGSREFKLVLRRHDQETLHALLSRDTLPSPSSERIRENYEFFREVLVDADLAAVYAGISRLLLVDVRLDRSVDDPQLIFESLNSTGMDLSQSDLIRNFILMRLPEAEQTRLYETLWLRIENLFKGSEKTFDAFIRDYLALKTEAAKQEKSDQIYFAFRRLFSAVVGDVTSLERFLEELQRFASYHAGFSMGTGASDKLKVPLARLRHVTDVAGTLIMQLFDCFDRLKTLSEGQFAAAIVQLESYVFRRAICGGQTNNYWREFANVAYRLDKTQPFESLSVGLALMRENNRFPGDDEFRAALEERDIYGLRVCRSLLETLENHENREPTELSNLSIEHIMPQNDRLPQEWREMLGSEWREVQQKWLHRLGNLTLTGYNSTYSDRPFEEKKTVPGGFSESAVRLNRFIRDQDGWTASQMLQRGKDLSLKALTIWPRLNVTDTLIDAEKQKRLRASAGRRDVEKVKMSANTRELFNALRVRMREIDDTRIIEIAEQKSVTYHAPDFFLEVIPRKRRINLLLALSFNEIDDPFGLAEDATQWKFIVNALYEGGVIVTVAERADIDKALPMVRQAFAVAST